MSAGAPKAPVTYAGPYDPDRTYLPLVIVTVDGGAYLSVATSTGVDPDPAAQTPWFPLGAGGGPVLFESVAADGPPTDGSVFWYVTDESC